MSGNDNNDNNKKKKNRANSLFVTNQGALTTPTFLLLAAVPLFWIGHWKWGIAAVVACFVAALLKAMGEIQVEDKHEIKFNVMEPEHVLDEMLAAHEQIMVIDDDDNDDNDKAIPAPTEEELCQGRIVIVTGLAALAKKFGKEKSRPNKNNSNNQQQQHALPLLCQEAAYVGFDSFPADNDVVSGAASLLALVAKDSLVRERHLHEADTFGLDRPVACMRQALKRAKAADKQTAQEEQASAELQRKCCLLLGALADGDSEIACQVAQEGGIDAVLDAVKWYRFHADVANWALWVLFILSYENSVNKVAVVQAGGVPTVIQTMLNVPNNKEVARHGIAILFDLLRQDESDNSSAGQPVNLDVWRIRNTALTAGLHRVVVRAMDEFCDAMDIMMMGQELLVGTDYQGRIPEYQPVK